jgi:hypothetical protein
MRKIAFAAIAAISLFGCTKTTTTPAYNVTTHRWHQVTDTSLHLTFSPDALYIHHHGLIPNPNATPYTRQHNIITIPPATLIISADTILWTNATKQTKFFRR